MNDISKVIDENDEDSDDQAGDNDNDNDDVDYDDCFGNEVADYDKTINKNSSVESLARDDRKSKVLLIENPVGNFIFQKDLDCLKVNAWIVGCGILFGLFAL